MDKNKEKLNDPTSNQDDINNITVNHIQDWKEIDNFFKINNFELYESMRFNLSNPELYDSKTVEDQTKFKNFIERFHHKDCNIEDWNLICQRTAENLIDNHMEDEIRKIANDYDTVIVSNEHKINDI